MFAFISLMPNNMLRPYFTCLKSEIICSFLDDLDADSEAFIMFEDEVMRLKSQGGSDGVNQNREADALGKSKQVNVFYWNAEDLEV